MIITAKADGTLIKTVPDRVYQGSNNADTIIVVAPIIQSATMNIRFKLPQINEYTQNFLMTPANDSIYSDLGVSVWTYSINSALTQYYGTVQAQFAATVNGAVVSSGAFTFEVERGVEVDLPDPADPNYTYDDIYDYLTDMSTRIFVNGDLEAKAILPYDETFSYRLGATIFNSGDFYTSLVNDNLGNALTDTTKWQKTDFYSAGEVDDIIDTIAGRKYPLGSTTGTGEIFNDYENNVASGDYSHAEGSYTVASANYAHAEGSGATASGATSHAEGSRTTASGGASHAEGINTTASGRFSHAGGGSSKALNDYSFAHGEDVSTSAKHQAVFGVYNVDDEDALFIVGNGELGLTEQESTKSNAFVVKKDGTIYGGDNKQLSTQEYVGTVAATKQDKIDSSHKLNADLVDDTNTTNKFVTASEKAQITTNSGNITNLQNNKVDKQPDGSNDLISNNKITTRYLPDFLLGQVLYGGNVTTGAVATLTVNAKSKLGTANNTITLSNDTTAITGYEANDGIYYIATADFTFAGLAILTGDWLISKGNAWDKIDNTDAVTGVKGNAENSYRIGNVEITPDNLDDTNTTNKFVTASEKAQINTNTTNIEKKVDKSTDGYGRPGPSPDSVIISLEGTVSNSSGRVAIASKGFEISLTDGRQYFNINEIKATESGVDINADAGARVNGNAIETQNNKVTSLSSSSTDTEYPTAKCVYDAINSAIVTTLNTPV